MKLIIAGKDRSRDVGASLRRRGETMQREAPARKPASLPAEISALALARAKSETEYLDGLIRLIRWRDGVSPLDFSIPRNPGLAGLIVTWLKAFLWKFLRYQHERVAFRQNLINTQLTSALEFECIQRQKETADLKRRVAELEKQGSKREA